MTGSTRVNWLITSTVGWMNVIVVVAKFGHEVPTKVARWNAIGGVNRLPQKHFLARQGVPGFHPAGR